MTKRKHIGPTTRWGFCEVRSKTFGRPLPHADNPCSACGIHNEFAPEKPPPPKEPKQRKPVIVQWGRCQARTKLYSNYALMRHLDSPCRVCGEHRVPPKPDESVTRFVNELLDKMYERKKLN